LTDRPIGDGFAPPAPPSGSRSRSGCSTFFLLAAGALTLLFLGLAAASVFLAGGARVPSGSVLVLDMGEELPETRPWSASWLAPAVPDFHGTIRALDRAAADERVRGLLIQGEGTTLGWERLMEMREAVIRFSESGKPVAASLEMPGLRDYLLATAADTIHMHPRGRLMLFGTPLGVLFYGELLEKVGIGAQFEAIGPFKNAPDSWTRSEMSEAHREQLAALSGELFDLASEAVATTRGVAVDEARALLSEGPLLAEGALSAGLIDGIRYPAEAREEFGQDFGKEGFLALRDYALQMPASDGSRRIAVVHVEGAILSGESRTDLVAGRVAGAETIGEALEWARDAESVAAVVLRIASPGGADTASDTIWRAASRLGSEKPVVASLGDVAASGGYWVATAADHLVAGPASITGSIGVYAGRLHLAGLFEKIGVVSEMVYPEGVEPGNWLNAAAPLSSEERERLREGIADTYAVFLERVGEARGMTADEVDAVGQGRVWSGRKAFELGLVDELGGLDAAIRRARMEAGIPEDAEVEILRLPEPPGFAEVALRELGVVRFRDRLPLVRALVRGNFFALLPFVPDPA